MQSATGIIVFSQVVIATSTGTETLMDDVEDLLCATGQPQIQTHFPVFAPLSNLHLGHGMLPTGPRCSGKRGIFRRRLFLVHRSSLSTGAGRDLGRLGLHAGRRNNTGHFRSYEDELRKTAPHVLASQPRSIARGQTLESNIALPSFTSMNSNAQQPRNRRHRRKNRFQNRLQLRSHERHHFVPRRRIIRTFAGRTQTIRTSSK